MTLPAPPVLCPSAPGKPWQQSRARSRIAAATSLLMMVAGGSANAAPDSRVVLLELFTSESCSSCPPADAYVGELGMRDDVLPLSFHVDYWDDLGWKDHFSSPAFTRRQQLYAGLIGSQVYTPQLVIDGNEGVVGSDRTAVEAAIQRAQVRAPNTVINLKRQDRQIQIELKPAAGSTVAGTSRLLLVSFDPLAEEAIHAGENRGRTINYHNIVRSLRDIGPWQGQALDRSELLQDNETGSRIALIAQDPRSGHILGVGATPPPRQ